MRLIYAMLLGFILDLIFGDPHGLIHPVQIIGWFIDKLKKGMQHMIYGCSYRKMKTMVSPSLLSANFIDLKSDIEMINKSEGTG